jgi:hypothetical protein
LAAVGDSQSGLLCVVNAPEDDRIYVDWNRIFCKCLLGTERRPLDALIDDRGNVVQNRHDDE